MKLFPKILTVATSVLLAAGFAGLPAWADSHIVGVNCTGGGTFTITSNVVTESSGCVSAVIPNSVTSIGNSAFFNATSLTSITIPNSVTSIGRFAFLAATSLTSITFEAGSVLESIGDYAFRDATSLTSIAIPNSVTSIGRFAFRNATSLTSITFEADSVLESIGDGAFSGDTSLTSITIPDSVTTIGDDAFVNATALASVTFEADSVLASIGDYAFYRATSLTSITIPNSVTSIGEYAFQDATALTSVTFEGNAPTTVGTDAFLNVGTDAVANIGFAATDFGEDITWNGLILVRAAGAPAPAPAPAPYSGPIPTNYSDKTPSVGDEVIISGLRMNLVTSCTIDGVTAVMSNQSADSFTIVIPIGVTSGLKDLVMTGPAGKLTAQGALTVQQIIPAIINEALVSSKLNAGSFNGYVAVYAKGHNGKTLSWKIAGKWFKTTITSDYQVFQRRTAAVGLDVDVHLYIDGEKQSTIAVRTR